MPRFSPRLAALSGLGALAALSAIGVTPAGSASPLAEVNAQIARYGCNLPQYADSVPECRELHARARALSAQGRPRNVPAPSYVAPVAPTPVPQRGGFFSGLFGGAPSSPGYQVSPYYQPGYPAPGSDGAGEPKQFHTFRTLCVRTCDGYYFPISYSTVRSRFAADEQICKSSCQADVKLFVHPNPDGEVEQATTARGERYADLPNAFRYRQEYVAGCKCRPDPWTAEAKEIYAQRALGVDAQPQLADAGTAMSDAEPLSEWSATVSPQPVLRRAEAPHPAFRRNGIFGWLAGF
ncbi:MAG: DUF2865 domain-containing protein [Hyphomicrobiales bacterium]